MKFESVVISVTREASDVTTMISEVKISSAEVEAQKLQLSKGEFLALTISQQWAPIEFQESCILKVRARVDDGNEIKLGALEVVFPDSRKEP